MASAFQIAKASFATKRPARFVTQLPGYVSAVRAHATSTKIAKKINSAKKAFVSETATLPAMKTRLVQVP
jgi:uncharacterized protein YdbL (DUF1318 family)